MEAKHIMKIQSLHRAATCCPTKRQFSEGLCYVCFLIEYTKRLKSKPTAYYEKAHKLKMLNEIIEKQTYAEAPKENIPDLKKSDYWLMGDARKLPNLLTVD